MGIQFDWQAGDEGGQWEMIAETRRKRWLRRVPRWIWYALTVVLVVGLAGGYFIVRRRYDQAQSQIVFQVQSVIDLEARSFSERDRDLFLAQQDYESPDWYDLQRSRVAADCTPDHPASAYCSPVLPAKIENLDMRGDVAWVEVIENDPPVRRVRFYRQTDMGWKHTSPQVDFWGTPIELHYGDVLLRYHRKDQPHIDPLLDHVVEVFYETCRDIGCPDDRSLEIDFAVDEFLPTEVAPPMQDPHLWLVPSPWLSGVPVDGSIDTPYVQSLTDQLARDLAAQAMGLGDDERTNVFKGILLDEYVAWRNDRNTPEAPILGHIVSLRGQGIVPGLFQWLAGQERPNLDDLLGRWLSLSPTGRGPVHFAALLNIEREALLAGHRLTFLMLQDSEDEVWTAQQAAFYDRVQSYENVPAKLRIPIEVEQVSINRDKALITLASPLPRLQGSAAPSMGPYVFFVLNDGEWKHSSVGQAVYWQIPVARAPLSPSMPLPEQEGVRISFVSSEPTSRLGMWVEQFQDRFPWVDVETPRMQEAISMPPIELDSLRTWIHAYDIALYQMAAMGDVIQWPFFSELSTPGLIRDLGPLVASDTPLSGQKLYPGMLEAKQWNGQIWGLPVYGAPVVIYYDRSVFSEAGLDYPQPGWTMEEFAQTAALLTVREGGKTAQYGFLAGDEPVLVRAFIEAYAGPLVDPSTLPATIRLNDPDTVEAVQWYVDLLQGSAGTDSHRSAAPESNGMLQDVQLPQDDVRIAMWAGSLQLVVDELDEGDVGIVSFPVGQYLLYPWYVETLAMTEGTSYPQESWLWIQWVVQTQSDMSGMFLESTDAVPAHPSVAEASGFWEQLEPETEAVIREAMTHAWSQRWDACTAALQEAMETIWDGTPVHVALDEAQASVEQLLE